MELRRAVDALVRVQSSPWVSLLSPLSTVRWTSRRQLGRRSSISYQSTRLLSTSTQRPAIRPLPTTSSTPPPPAPTDSTSAEASRTPNESSSPSASPRSTSDDLASLTAELGWSDPSRLSAPRRIGFQPPAWRASSSSSTHEQRLNGGSSASDLLSAINATRAAKRAERDPFARLNPSSSTLDVSKMMQPLGTHDGLSISRDVDADLRVPKPVRVPLNLNPSTGRSVGIGGGIDVGRGFRLLEQSCARNGVKRDANTQRFHERGGLKRKRLRRERWRRKFLEGFKATVGRVKQLKNQGW